MSNIHTFSDIKSRNNNDLNLSPILSRMASRNNNIHYIHLPCSRDDLTEEEKICEAYQTIMNYKNNIY